MRRERRPDPLLEQLIAERPAVAEARAALRAARVDVIEEIETWRARLRLARLLRTLARPLLRAFRGKRG